MHASALREMIDACRSGSSDLNEPEFAELACALAADPAARRQYDATQKFDGAFGAALKDVEVPAGLADRLLSAVSANVQENSALPQHRVITPAARGPAKTWANALEATAPLAAILLAAAALLAVVVWSRAPAITGDQLAERSFDWLEQLDQGEWNDNLRDAPRDDFPLSTHATVAAERWQHLKTPRAELVAYQGGPPRVVLFVVRSKTKVEGLNFAPKLLRSTGGWSVGAWQAGDLTYVLVVEGDRRIYESHLKAFTAA